MPCNLGAEGAQRHSARHRPELQGLCDLTLALIAQRGHRLGFTKSLCLLSRLGGVHKGQQPLQPVLRRIPVKESLFFDSKRGPDCFRTQSKPPDLEETLPVPKQIFTHDPRLSPRASQAPEP